MIVYVLYNSLRHVIGVFIGDNQEFEAFKEEHTVISDWEKFNANEVNPWG